METKVAELPLADKVWAWLLTNKKPVLGGAAAVTAVGLIIWFIAWQKDEKEVVASQALSNVAVGQLSGGAHADMAQAYLKVAADYPNAIAGARALLLAAGTCFAEGKFAESQAQFERFAREHHTSPFMGEALLGIAACLDAQGKTEPAVAAYKNLIDHHPGEDVVPQAKFALGRLYEAQAKPELARGLFEEVERQDPFGTLGSEAGMRLEEIKTKYPNLTPATPALTNAPFHAPAFSALKAPAKAIATAAPTNAPGKK